ncbi:hypothetical protein I6I18_11270 [Kytococcus sedentarius]|uniref:Uncharacterized protein n=1 Tax=Kytococcus sedentarius (strain ATCC 14392 / DSM 20547 / JCM 11482 / CCUG 33030 / NBRC 15357 / NCTC 11040 / CCM 314 / 541) TaxID=478801 RepID=C7NIE0_KYTSD|nr:hypothetical protein [Kytococcus sedentarius]ACV05111.1 hypothetical protein Ksed_00130 [Kytococcus sedentarius DSM 20547]QQB63585.1 hypothetical protein I6I18_11270 [Kytococcus sedentarius]STX13485.1 Uncharacterised protein [Kytococcus sedentarius]
MIDNPFRKKTASERWAESARTRFHAAADASHDAGERAKKLGEHTAEGVSASAKSAGSALGALIPTVAAAFASGRSKAAHGLDEGVDHGAESVTHGLDAAPEKVDQARDWIVEELLPKLQGMVDDTVDAKNNAAAQGGALSVVAGETVRTPKRKGGVLMVLGLAMLGGAAYFWYTDQKRRQGDPWQRVSSSDDPWAATSGRRAVSAAANPGAGMRSTAATEPAPTAGEKVHLTPSEAAAAREENVDRPVSALASGTTAGAATTPAAGAATPDTAETTVQRTTEKTVVESRPLHEKVDENPATDATVTRTERRFEDPANTGPIATGYADRADDIAGDNAPTQSIPTVGERLNPRDARPADTTGDPYTGPNPTIEDPARDSVKEASEQTDAKWLRN